MCMFKKKITYIALFRVPVWKNFGWKYNKYWKKQTNIENVVTLFCLFVGKKRLIKIILISPIL